MSLCSKNTVFHWSKVAYCKYWWRDRFDTIQRKNKPDYPTAYGEPIPEDLMVKARERDLIDIWTPVVKVQLSNSHSLMFEGDRATKIWNEWKKRCYAKPARIKQPRET